MKSIYKAATLAGAFALLSGCAHSTLDMDKSAQSQTGKALAVAAFQFATDGASGQAVIRIAGGQPVIEVNTTGLSKGLRGFHLHQVGKCEAPGFTSAGSHLNPLGKNHGTKAEGGSHVGDLPNLATTDGGTASLTAPIEGSAEQLENWLFDSDGTAAIIHEGPDDYLTDPTGNAGGRIACAVFTKAE